MKSTSRYALIDDVWSDDDEPMSDTLTTTGASVSFADHEDSGGAASMMTSQKKEESSILRRREQTPFAKPNRVHFGDVSETEIQDAITAKAAECYAEVFKIAEKVASPGGTAAMIVDEELAGSNPEDNEIVEEEISSEMFDFVDPSDLLEAQEQGPKLKQLLMTTAASATRSSIDFGWQSGRISRAGWHPSGRFLHPINLLRPVYYQPKFFTATGTPSLSLEPLTILLSKCSMDHQFGLLPIPLALQNGGDDQSHAGLLDCLQSIGSVSCSSEEARGSFNLLAALLESPESSLALINPGAGEAGQTSYTFNERRNQALLRWLIDVNASEVQLEVQSALVKKDVAGAIFAAVSGGDLALAAKVAADAGELDLALALASGTEGRSDLAKMLARLAEAGVSIPVGRLRTLRAISGSTTLEESFCRKGSSRLSWQKRLALKLIQDPAEDLRTLIANYAEDVKNGVAPFPSPKYASSSRPDLKSVQYRILQAVADPRSLDLCKVVDTNGYTANPHDLSVSFLLAVALVASGYVASNDLSLERISSGFEAQLIDQGSWEWAVAVSLLSCVSSDLSTSSAKIRRAHEHVLHFFHKGKDSQRHLVFLEKQIGIPSEWISEALAYRSADAKEFVNNFVNFDPQEALSLLERQFLPDLFFSNKSQAFEMLSRIKDLLDQAPDSLAYRIHQLYLLDAKVRSQAAKADPESLAAFEAECNSIGEALVFASREEKERNELSPFSDDCLADTNSLIQEALEQVQKIRFQLASVAKQQSM